NKDYRREQLSEYSTLSAEQIRINGLEKILELKDEAIAQLASDKHKSDNRLERYKKTIAVLHKDEQELYKTRFLSPLFTGTYQGHVLQLSLKDNIVDYLKSI